MTSRKIFAVVAAAVAASIPAFSVAQDSMMVPDAKASKPGELMSFINKDAYKKLSAPDAYYLVSFLGDLPGNYQTALLRGLVMNAQEAQTIKDRRQAEANAMPPLGDTMPPMVDSGFRQGHRGDRSFEMISMDPMARVSYYDVLALLQKDQDATDQSLLGDIFRMRSFTEDQLMFPRKERAVDVISRYIKANGMSTQPVRLKYTSLAPRTYVSPVIPR